MGIGVDAPAVLPIDLLGQLRLAYILLRLAYILLRHTDAQVMHEAAVRDVRGRARRRNPRRDRRVRCGCSSWLADALGPFGDIERMSRSWCCLGHRGGASTMWLILKKVGIDLAP
ncbi:hypothetical protein ACQP25_29915 [Microtetraspora malaysiensis]|uniref:hypothetical protein n=1 Tax=Microtetraspora malaysiensis TaxID=161358 RepID=UPI003D8C679A